ncbi:MAG TPA: hypothetical protein VMZ71_09455, partial [Gemmataceae bacterium]|nr:hypothetical protein [Gemmataceae bacterium]
CVKILPEMLTLHLRINDAATGQPTPVRICVTGPDSSLFAPLGRPADFPTTRGEFVGGQVKLGAGRWSYVDGACEITLPAGVPLRIRASKGPEFRPLDETVVLGAGQLSLRFAISRWSNLAAEGWVSGDSRCHFLSPHAAVLEGRAEGLDVVNVLSAETRLLAQDGDTYWGAPEILAFSGQEAALERGGCAVAVNTLNVHPVLGKVGLLNSHRPVFPLAFGGPDVTDDWSLSDWCQQCHRKGGLTVWVDAFRESAGLIGCEALVCAILGNIDAIEFDAAPRPKPFLPWVYRLWNAGFLVPLVGGSGKDGNGVALGSVRTWARIAAEGGFRPSPLEGEGQRAQARGERGESLLPLGTASPGVELTPLPAASRPPSPSRGEGKTEDRLRQWIDAVRAGRTFVTTGPLLDFAADETLRVSARSLAPFDKLELVADGDVIASAPSSQSDGIWSAELPHPRPACGWVAGRIIGKDVFAHTSPVRVGEPRRAESDLAPLRLAVEKTCEWIETLARFHLPKRKEQHLARIAEALARLGAAP